MFEVSCLLSFDLSVDLYLQSRDLTEVMSGRRLRNCTNCGQRHYAPSGAKCPHAPETPPTPGSTRATACSPPDADTGPDRTETAPYQAPPSRESVDATYRNCQYTGTWRITAPTVSAADTTDTTAADPDDAYLAPCPPAGSPPRATTVDPTDACVLYHPPQAECCNQPP